MDLRIKVFIVAVLAANILTPFAGWLGRKMGAVDMPASRKVHKKPTPRTGGIAIYLSFLVAIGIAGIYGEIGDHESVMVLLFGSALIFVVGLVDDIRGLGAWTKLIFQIIVALSMVYFNVRITIFIQSWIISALLTCFWVTGITNAFNLLDNMNGLSPGIAMISSLLFLVVSIQQGLPSVGIVAAALAGALFGFLRFNFPSGRIFMGDAGSLSVGYILATMAVMGTYVISSRLRHLPVITPVLILAVPLFDTFSVILIRWKNKLPIFQADRNHISHRLVDLGLSQPMAVMLVWLLGIGIGMSALLLPRIMLYEAVGIFIQALISLTIVVILMYYPRNKQKMMESHNFDVVNSEEPKISDVDKNTLKKQEV